MLFRAKTKTKTLPRSLTPRKKGSFTKKPMSRREVPSTPSESIGSEESSGNWLRLYGLLWIAFFSVSAYVLLFSPFLRLDTVRIDGASDFSRQDVERFIRSDMEGKYFGFLPRNTLFVFPREKIESDILARFKQIRSVEADSEFPRTLVVRMQEREAIALWCSGQDCFHVDADGYAYVMPDVSQDSDQGYLPKIVDSSEQPVDTSEPLLESGFTRLAFDIRNRLARELHIETDRECSTPSRFSDQLTLKTQEGWLLHIDARLSLDDSLRALKLVLQKEISSERRQRLKYIDLRTAQRVYYSVDGETVSAPDPAVDPAQTPSSSASSVAGNAAAKDKKK